MQVGEIITLKDRDNWYRNTIFNRLIYTHMDCKNKNESVREDEYDGNYLVLGYGYSITKLNVNVVTYDINKGYYVKLQFDMLTPFSDGIDVVQEATEVNLLKIRMMLNKTVEKLQEEYGFMYSDEEFNKILKEYEDNLLDTLKVDESEIFYLGDKVLHQYYEDVYTIRYLRPQKGDKWNVTLQNEKDTLYLVVTLDDLKLVERAKKKDYCLNTVILRKFTNMYTIHRNR